MTPCYVCAAPCRENVCNPCWERFGDAVAIAYQCWHQEANGERCRDTTIHPYCARHAEQLRRRLEGVAR